MPLTIVADPGSNVSTAARSEIEAAAMRLASGVEIAQLIIQAYESRDAFPGEAAREQFVEESRERAFEAWSDPTLTVVTHASGAIEEEEEEGTLATSGFAHSSVGIMVQFVMSGLISAGEILVLERKSRALQRLLTTAISRVEIILGHFLAMFLTILLQTTLLIGFGQVALGVDYLRTPLATGLMMVTTSLWAASMGLLIGVLARSEEQVIIFSLVPMFILSALGGAWMPLEFTSETFQAVGHFLPTAWAIDGFENLVVRSLGLDSVLVPAAIVAGYALVFFVLAVWRFRFE
jgi:ABC-2 type transport system permease protein